MKQLCGVAKARSFGIAATMSYRLDVATIHDFRLSTL